MEFELDYGCALTLGKLINQLIIEYYRLLIIECI